MAASTVVVIDVPLRDSAQVAFTDDQHLLTQGPARQRAEQRRQQRTISALEPDPFAAQLALQDPDLVSRCQDLRVLLPAAHRK